MSNQHTESTPPKKQEEPYTEPCYTCNTKATMVLDTLPICSLCLSAHSRKSYAVECVEGWDE